MSKARDEAPVDRLTLAKMVINTLDAQEAYFKARKRGLPGPVELATAKRLEKELRAVASVITAPPSLFDAGEED